MAKSNMELCKALTLKLGNLNQPAITRYGLSILLFQLCRDKKHRGQKITDIPRSGLDENFFEDHLEQLVNLGILSPGHAADHRGVFSILGKDQSASGDIACCIDPFAYVSHLSAMEWHGLTDRLPKLLFISSPPVKEWRKYASEKMARDVGEENIDTYLASGLPRLHQLKVNKINKRTVNRFSSLHLGAFVSIKDRNLRVSTIGRTFLDMIKRPDLCSGIYHVLDVYGEFAKTYLRLIVDEINRHGAKIDKVRAGYILSERNGLDHPMIKRWKQFVQRGGSRKLYTKNEYSSNFSETWSLSINIEG